MNILAAIDRAVSDLPKGNQKRRLPELTPRTIKTVRSWVQFSITRQEQAALETAEKSWQAVFALENSHCNAKALWLSQQAELAELLKSGRPLPAGRTYGELDAFQGHARAVIEGAKAARLAITGSVAPLIQKIFKSYTDTLTRKIAEIEATDRKEAELLGVDFVVSAEQLCVEAVREFASRRATAPTASNGSPSSLIEGVITLNQ
jgi:transposase